jgi:hypothetical protein
LVLNERFNREPGRSPFRGLAPRRPRPGALTVAGRSRGWEQEMIDVKSHLEPKSAPETYRVLDHIFGCGVRSITFFERINFILPSSLPSTESIGAIRVIPFTFSPTPGPKHRLASTLPTARTDTGCTIDAQARPSLCGRRRVHISVSVNRRPTYDAVTRRPNASGALQRSDKHAGALPSIHRCASCCVTKPGIWSRLPLGQATWTYHPRVDVRGRASKAGFEFGLFIAGASRKNIPT